MKMMLALVALSNVVSAAPQWNICKTVKDCAG